MSQSHYRSGDFLSSNDDEESTSLANISFLYSYYFCYYEASRTRETRDQRALYRKDSCSVSRSICLVDIGFLLARYCGKRSQVLLINRECPIQNYLNAQVRWNGIVLLRGREIAFHASRALVTIARASWLLVAVWDRDIDKGSY